MELHYVNNLYNQNQQLKQEVENLKNELFNEQIQTLELLLQNKKLKEHACNAINYCTYPCNKYYEWHNVEGEKGNDD